MHTETACEVSVCIETACGVRQCVYLGHMLSVAVCGLR